MESIEHNKPLVSILTNTYNRSNLIHRCIESVQKQTFQNYEHIIVDGNSTDNTEQVVKSYNDPHIVYIRLNDRGPEKQMRAGSSIAKGKYIAFLDDDDEYLPEKLEKQIAFFESLPEEVGLTYCWMTYFDNNAPDKPLYSHATKLRGDVRDIVLSAPLVCGTPTIMVRKEVFLSAGGTFDDSTGIIGNDWELFARVCQNCHVDYLPESLVKVYINHGHARLSTNFYDERARKSICNANHFLTLFRENFLRHPEYRATHFYSLSWSYRTLNKKRDAWRYFRLFLQCRPKLVLCLRLLIKLLFNR